MYSRSKIGNKRTESLLSREFLFIIVNPTGCGIPTGIDIEPYKNEVGYEWQVMEREIHLDSLIEFKQKTIISILFLKKNAINIKTGIR